MTGDRPVIQGTRLMAVLGDPVDHSLSPRMHRCFIDWAGIDARYEAIRVPSGELASALERLVARGVVGVNLTVPHKQDGFRWVDEVEGVAQAVGAINCIRWDGAGRSFGFNSDVDGLRRALSGAAASSGAALVLGAGGAARAAVAALTREGYGPIHVLARRPEEAQRLVGDLGGEAGPLDARRIADVSHAAWVINATSCGVGDQADISPWPAEAPWPEGTRVMDLVYGDTPFLRDARALGHRAFDGLDMLLWQGAIAFGRWMDLPIPPPDVIAHTRRHLLEGAP